MAKKSKGIYVCHECGAFTEDKELHVDWHMTLSALIKAATLSGRGDRMY